MLKVFLTAAVTLICVAAVREHKKEYAVVAEASGAVLVLSMLLPTLRDGFSLLSEYTQAVNMGGEYFSLLGKVVVATVATELASAACKDAGNGLLSVAVELAGRLVILSLSLPLVRTVIGIAMSMARG